MADHKIHTDPAGNWTGTDPAGSTVDSVLPGEIQCLWNEGTG